MAVSSGPVIPRLTAFLPLLTLLQSYWPFAVLEICQASSCFRDFPLALFSACNTLSRLYVQLVPSSIWDFLLKCQLRLSLATQCKLQISPTPPQFSFLFYVSFLVSLITISHLICFTYPIFCLFRLGCKGKDFVQFTALSSACRSTVPGSCYILS